MPRIVEARLTPWEPGIPGIWFRYYHDGIEARQKLSRAAQAELIKRLEACRAVNRS